MQARLKQDCKYPTLRLFFGREYNKTTWQEVPDGFEEQAAHSEFLDVKLVEDAETVVYAVHGDVVIPSIPTDDFIVLDTEDNTPEATETPVVTDAPAPTGRNRHSAKR